MKFKYLIIAFSIFIVFILLAVILLPSFLVVPEFAANFHNVALPFSIFITIVVISISAFFFFNYRLLSLLEREDWPALAYYLENKIFVKRQYSSRKVRLLASSYMVMSDYPAVLKLEGKAIHAKPSVVRDNVLIFGAARVLSGNHADAAAFFKTYLDKGKFKNGEWVRWYYGFSQLLGGSFSKSETEFLSMAVNSEEALITGLSAYFLSNTLTNHSLRPAECRAAAETGRERVVKSLKNRQNWQKEEDRIATEIHIAIIRKYIDEAGKWLFENDRAGL